MSELRLVELTDGRDGPGSRAVADQPPVDLRATGLEAACAELVALAADLTGAPIAVMAVADHEGRWSTATSGVVGGFTPREGSICAWATGSPEGLLVLPDASVHPSFADLEVVTGEPHVRFYAGVEVRSAEGRGLGTVCVVDTHARSGLTVGQARGLHAVARQVERLFELRRVSVELLSSQRWSQALVEQASDLVIVTDATGIVTFASSAASSVLGYDPVDDLGRNVLDLLHPDDVGAALESFVATASSSGLREPFELRVAHRDGSWRWVEVVANNQLDDPDIGGIVFHVRDAEQRHTVEERVRTGERRLAEAQRLARMGSWEIDLSTQELVWSEGLYALFGLEVGSFEPSLEHWQQTMRPEEREVVLATIRQAVIDCTTFDFRRHVLLPDGDERFVDCHGEVERGEDGFVRFVRGTAIDITERWALERSLDRERRFLRAVLDNLDEGVVACDADGVLSLFNPATERLHGGARVSPVGLAQSAELYDLYASDGTTPLTADEVPLTVAFTSGRVDGREIVIAPPDGEPRLVACSGQVIVDEGGTRIGAVVTMRDVTAERRLEQRLRRLADHDVLTGLPNRAVLTNRLVAGLRRGERTGLLFIDLDGFKRLNDEHGHNTGDKVLAAVAARLRGAIKDSDTAARLGGDEFVVLLVDVAGEAVVGAVAERVRSSIERPIEVDGVVVHPRVSVGWAISTAGERSAEALIARADRAMYLVKQRGDPTG